MWNDVEGRGFKEQGNFEKEEAPGQREGRERRHGQCFYWWMLNPVALWMTLGRISGVPCKSQRIRKHLGVLLAEEFTMHYPGEDYDSSGQLSQM